FVSVMDPTSNAAHGFMEYTVSPTELTGRFVRSAGAAFSDGFAITSPTGEEAPFAGDLSTHTTRDTGVPLVLHGSDNAQCELTFSIATPPGHGTLSSPADEPCTPGSPNRDDAAVTYTPGAGFTGTDTFTYQVTDDSETSTAATVTVKVTDPGTTTSSTTTTTTSTTTTSSTTTTTTTTTT